MLPIPFIFFTSRFLPLWTLYSLLYPFFSNINLFFNCDCIICSIQFNKYSFFHKFIYLFFLQKSINMKKKHEEKTQSYVMLNPLSTSLNPLSSDSELSGFKIRNTLTFYLGGTQWSPPTPSFFSNKLFPLCQLSLSSSLTSLPLLFIYDYD